MVVGGLKIVQLDPVQVEALRLSKGKRGFAYFISMGLGKSLLVLEEFHRAVDERIATRLVVISPNSFKSGWLEEIEDKSWFGYDTYVYISGLKSNDVIGFDTKRYEKPPVLIINYEAMRMPAVLLKIMAWMRVKSTFLALDESISIKTHDSEQTRAALKLAVEASIVRILTGLPQTQGPADLYPQLRAIGLFEGVKFWAFRNTFCVMGGWENKQIVGVKHAEGLARIMGPAVFEALKAYWWAAAPRKDGAIRTYEMSGEQAAQYKQMRDEFLLELENSGEIVMSVDVAVSKYEEAQSQIQLSWLYSQRGRECPRVLVEPEKNPRLLCLMETLAGIDGKTVIIYRHRYSYEILSAALKDFNPAFIKGQMKPIETGDQKRLFNGDPRCRLMLGQCDAIKYGHTLLGGEDPRDRCFTMIFFESSYSLDTRTQDEDRIHRRGQRENCLYIDLAGSDLDRRVVKALQKKQNLYEAVFSKLRASATAL